MWDRKDDSAADDSLHHRADRARVRARAMADIAPGREVILAGRWWSIGIC
jgi:hypothetical protein